MRRLFLFLLFCLPISAQWSNGYTYKGTFIIDPTKCGTSDSANFGTLLSVTDATLKVVGSSGGIQHTVTQSGGNAVTMPADLIFTSDSGGTTKVPWEIESYGTTSGVLVAWVKVATVSHTAPTTFYMWYGNSGVSTQQNTSSFAPANVWDSNFEVVYHVPDGTTPSFLDSTVNAYNGSNTGATGVAGEVDGAILLNGGFFTSSGTNMNSWTQQTISFWVNLTLSGTAQFARLLEKGFNNEWTIITNFTGSDTTVYLQVGGSGTVANSNSGLAGAWHYVHATIDASFNGKIYVDGVLQTVNSAGFSNSTTGTLNVGQAGSGGGFHPNADIDEIRISNVVRATSWITTEYNNQFSPATFYSTITLAQTNGGSTPTQVWVIVP